MGRQIKYSVIHDDGYQQSGYTPLAMVPDHLAKFEREAAQILERTDCDHVLYGTKVYNEFGDLVAIQFSLRAMTDQEFYRIAGRGRGVLIYALHNHRRGG